MAAMYLCHELDEHPTTTTFTVTVGEMLMAGYPPEKVDKVVWFASTYACPEHQPLAEPQPTQQNPRRAI